jgi:hypothetical protein
LPPGARLASPAALTRADELVFADFALADFALADFALADFAFADFAFDLAVARMSVSGM